MELTSGTQQMLADMQISTVEIGLETPQHTQKLICDPVLPIDPWHTNTK